MIEGNTEDLLPASPASYYSSLEVSSVDQMPASDNSLDFKRRLRGSGYSLKTSSELLQVLERILSLEKQHASNISLVKALEAELNHAQSRMKKLMQEQKVYHQEMDDLMMRVSEDKLVRKKKEQNKIKAAVQSIKNELEDERKLRRCSESLHRKLGKGLYEMNSTLKKVFSDLETERKTRKLLEDLCDEFAKGVVDYDLELRDLKQNQEEDADPKLDRLVHDISETWLKRRSRLKIAEFQENEIEQKTITERLFSEIMAFLQARNSYGYTHNDVLHKDRKKECTVRRHSVESVHINGAGSAPQDAEDDDSIANDLHYLELKKDADNSDSRSNLKLHSKECTEKTEGTRKSNHIAYPEKMKCHDICNLKVQFEEHADRTDLCVEDEEQLVDSLKSTHFHADADGRKVHPNDKHRDSFNKFARRKGHSVPVSECDPADVLYHLSRLGKQMNSGHASCGHEISECSSKQPQNIRESSLKEKLLEARLEGRYARSKASQAFSIDERQKQIAKQ